MRREDRPAEEASYQQAEQEFRSISRLEAEESEREAAQLAMRVRSLADVVFDAMARGDLIAVTTGSRTFTGRVTYVASDLMTMEASGATVDFNLEGPVAILIMERGHSGGVARGEGPGSFRGRLLEYEDRHGTVELGSVLFPGPLRGTLKVAARDHVLLEVPAGQEWVIPLKMISYVTVPSE